MANIVSPGCCGPTGYHRGVTGHEAPLVAILGPTGAGKSELALRLAGELGGEIVNYDSVQVYRGFDIGSAKVKPADRRGIPHHLIDILEPAEIFTAGAYALRARGTLDEIRARGSLPVLAGGTGFYLRSLLEGLSPGPERDASLRARLRERARSRPDRLHRILRRLDPEAAIRIHPHDVQKVIRALEMRMVARRTSAELFAEPKPRLSGFRIIRVGLDPPRPLLYERINARTEVMFRSGLLEEVKQLLERGAREDAKPFGSLGYRQALSLLSGAIGLEEAIETTRRETRRYSKRQMTWFRREPAVLWFRGFGDDPQVGDEAVSVIRKLLTTAG